MTRLVGVVLVLVIAVLTLRAEDQGRRFPIRLGAGIAVETGGGDPGEPAATCGTANVETWEHPRLIVCGEARTQIMADLVGDRATEFNTYLAAIVADWDSIGSSADFNVLTNLAFVLNTWQDGPNYGGKSQEDFEGKFIGTVDALLAMTDSDLCDSGELAPMWLALSYDWTVWMGLWEGTRSGASKSRAEELSDCMKLWTMSGGGPPLHHRRGMWLLNEMWYGLAFANDGIDDEEAETRLALDYVSNASTGFLALWQLFAGDDGGYPDGWSYTAQDSTIDPHFWYEAIFWEAYRTAYGDTDIWTAGHLPHLEYYAQPFAYFLSPYTATGPCTALDFKTSQTTPVCFDGSASSANGRQSHVMLAVANVYASTNADMASLAKWAATNYLPELANSSGGTCGGPPGCWARDHGWYRFFSNAVAGVTAKSPATLGLPLSKAFNNYGVVSMRTGWTSTDDSVVHCISQKYRDWGGLDYGLHGVGHCQLSRGAPLLIKAGAGVHHTYEEHSWASNVPNFVDPNEEAPGGGFQWDQGGQREGSSVGVIDQVSDVTPGSIFDVGGLTLMDLYVAGGDHEYDYLFGDLTRAYNSSTVSDGGNTVKVDQTTREVVFFRGASRDESDLLCVADNTDTTDSKFAQRITWHLAGDPNKKAVPSISGHSGTSNETRGGHTHTRYEGADGLSYSYSGSGMTSGKLFGAFLWPSDSDVVLIGGPNGSGQYYQSDSHEFEDQYGVNHIASAGAEVAVNHPWMGLYRIDHQNGGTASQTVHFMSCWEAAPSDASAATTITAISGTGTIGMQFGNQWGWVTKAAFGTFSGGTATWTPPASQTIDYLVSRLPASTAITFSKGSDVTSITNIADDDTDLTYTSTAAGTLWLRVVTGSGSSRTVTIASP